MTLYEKIGADMVKKILTEFYMRAFVDPMICHLFMPFDREHLTAQQIDFVTGLLGGPRNYRGKPLPVAHRPLKLRVPHFGRRQVIMEEVMHDLGLDPALAREWLALELALKPLVFQK